MSWQSVASTTLAPGAWFVTTPIALGRFFKLHYTQVASPTWGRIAQCEVGVGDELTLYQQQLIRFDETGQIFEFEIPSCFASQRLALQVQNTRVSKHLTFSIHVELLVWNEVRSIEKVDVQLFGLTPSAIGAEVAGAAIEAKNEAIAEAQRRIDLLTADDLDADPAGAATQAKNEAIAEAQRRIDLLTAADVDADAAGAATQAKNEAILEAQRRIDLLTAADVDAIALSEKGQPNGVATLGQDQKLSPDQLPPISNPTIQYLTRLNFPWWSGKISGAGTWQLETNTSFYNGCAATISTKALGDEVVFTFPLPAGNYVLDVRGERNSNQGILAFYINDVEIGSIDRYQSTVTRHVYSLLNFSFPGDNAILSCKVTGRNALSGGYHAKLSALLIYPA